MLVADASLWRDELRIYEVQNISLNIGKPGLYSSSRYPIVPIFLTIA